MPDAKLEALIEIIGKSSGTDPAAELDRIKKAAAGAGTASHEAAGKFGKTDLSLRELRRSASQLAHELPGAGVLLRGLISIPGGALAAAFGVFTFVKGQIASIGALWEQLGANAGRGSQSWKSQMDVWQQAATNMAAFHAKLAEATNRQSTLKEATDKAVEAMRKQNQVEQERSDKGAAAKLAEVDLLEKQGRINPTQATVIRANIEKEAADKKLKLQNKADAKAVNMRQKELEDAEALLKIQTDIADKMNEQVQILELRMQKNAALLAEVQAEYEQSKTASEKSGGVAAENREMAEYWRKIGRGGLPSAPGEPTKVHPMGLAFEGIAQIYDFLAAQAEGAQTVSSQERVNAWQRIGRREGKGIELAGPTARARAKAAGAMGRAEGTAEEVGGLNRELPGQNRDAEINALNRKVANLQDQINRYTKEQEEINKIGLENAKKNAGTNWITIEAYRQVQRNLDAARRQLQAAQNQPVPTGF